MWVLMLVCFLRLLSAFLTAFSFINFSCIAMQPICQLLILVKLVTKLVGKMRNRNRKVETESELEAKILATKRMTSQGPAAVEKVSAVSYIPPPTSLVWLTLHQASQICAKYLPGTDQRSLMGLQGLDTR